MILDGGVVKAPAVYAGSSFFSVKKKPTPALQRSKSCPLAACPTDPVQSLYWRPPSQKPRTDYEGSCWRAPSILSRRLRDVGLCAGSMTSQTVLSWIEAGPNSSTKLQQCNVIATVAAEECASCDHGDGCNVFLKPSSPLSAIVQLAFAGCWFAFSIDRQRCLFPTL